jgi:hypothetical protein
MAFEGLPNTPATIARNANVNTRQTNLWTRIANLLLLMWLACTQRSRAKQKPARFNLPGGQPWYTHWRQTTPMMGLQHPRHRLGLGHSVKALLKGMVQTLYHNSDENTISLPQIGRAQ